MSGIRVRVPAKINLHLEVLGRRPDGYHELRTLFTSIGLWDELEVFAADEGVLDLEVEPAGCVAGDDDNLVMRAARALWLELGREPGARMKLKKAIPVGAGLGGGSADAAAALVALDHLWKLGLQRPVLHRIAAGLGSDVPFFLFGGLAWGVGRGDEVYPLTDRIRGVALVAMPGVSVSTRLVYERLDRQGGWHPHDPKVYSFIAGTAPAVPWGALRNDLQRCVVGTWPEVGLLLKELERCGSLRAAVTGSGSAVYALFADEEGAREALSRLTGGRRVFIAPVLPRSSARLEPQRF
jgi:4-diphosphocytidyl-2-C-methyl-D-erythritol kinase